MKLCGNAAINAREKCVIYDFRVSNRGTKAVREMFSKLTIKIPELCVIRLKSAIGQ